LSLNHHERRKLTPDYDDIYDEGSLEANGLHSDPKKRYTHKKVPKKKRYRKGSGRRIAVNMKM
jgi:hypothetical protein